MMLYDQLIALPSMRGHTMVLFSTSWRDAKALNHQLLSGGLPYNVLIPTTCSRPDLVKNENFDYCDEADEEDLLLRRPKWRSGEKDEGELP